MSNQKGFTPIFLVILVIILVFIGAFFISKQKVASPEPNLESSASLAPSVLVQQQANSLSSCTEITSPGKYILEDDLMTDSSNEFCIRISSVQDTILDCNNHQLKNLQIKNSSNFRIENCQIGTKASTAGSTNRILFIDKSDKGEIFNNKFSYKYIEVLNSNNLKISNNTFDQLHYQQSYTSDTQITNNHFIADKNRGIPALIISSYGTNNTFAENIIEGSSKGIFIGISQEDGADDGIFITDEKNDIISSNNISNIWDCGIETSGHIENSSFTNNKIKNAGICGIGGWYWNSWKGNKVVNNQIDDAPYLFYFYRTYGLRKPEEIVYFQDNSFENNNLIPRRVVGISNSEVQFSSYINMFDFPATISTEPEILIKPDSVKIGNNRFTNNDFGAETPGPRFRPITIVTDGGNNRCKSIQDESLKCKN